MSSLRLLWVKVGGLWPPTTGGRLRSLHMIGELSRRHRVTVVTTHRSDDDAIGLHRALPGCQRVVSFPYAPPKQGTVGYAAAVMGSWLTPFPVDIWRWCVPAVRQSIEAISRVAQVDVCVADFLLALPNIPLDLGPPTILFEHNVEYLLWKRLASVEMRRWRRVLLELEWRKMRRYERRACGRVTGTVAVSEVDRAALQANATGARIVAIRTGVDTQYFAPNGVGERPRSLVFTGSMDWYPNEDAVLHFATAMLPQIRAAVPDVSFVVAGRDPSPRLRSVAAATGFEVTGTVDDIRPHLAHAEVCVVPLRVGGGTRLKILEALAMGKPVVSTAVGVEGLPLVPGEHFVRADAPADFSGAVVSLLNDRARRTALGVAGRRLVSEQCSWSIVAREFEAECWKVVSAHAR